MLFVFSHRCSNFGKNVCKLPIILSLIIASMFQVNGVAGSSTSAKCPGQTGYFYTNDRNKRNPRAGGFVSDGANVGDNVFIAPTAAVCDSASVLKYARVYGNAVVGGESEVTDKARVYGNARVSGSAVIMGEAKVSQNATVYGEAVVSGNAWLKGYYSINYGEVSSGSHTAPKPASIAKAEKDAANAKKAAEQKRIAEENKRRNKVQQESSLSKIMRELQDGYYTVRNYNRRTTYITKWSKGSVSNACQFSMSRKTKEEITSCYEGKSRDCMKKSYQYETMDLNMRLGFTTFVENEYNNKYCFKISSRGEDYFSEDAKFCFNRNRFNKLFDRMKKYRDNYCL